jgi:Domain of unknown function (DUF4483)
MFKSTTSNCLLVKGDLGKGKPFTQKLPDENFTYGKPLYRDPENAVDCKN